MFSATKVAPEYQKEKLEKSHAVSGFSTASRNSGIWVDCSDGENSDRQGGPMIAGKKGHWRRSWQYR
jgi:hypothetical protein